MAAAVQARPEEVWTLELHAMEARVADARIRVLRHHDAIGDVGATVLRKMARYRQAFQINVSAGEHVVEDRALLHEFRRVELVAKPATGIKQLRLFQDRRERIDRAIAD